MSSLWNERSQQFVGGISFCYCVGFIWFTSRWKNLLNSPKFNKWGTLTKIKALKTPIFTYLKHSNCQFPLKNLICLWTDFFVWVRLVCLLCHRKEQSTKHKKWVAGTENPWKIAHFKICGHKRETQTGFGCFFITFSLFSMPCTSL